LGETQYLTTADGAGGDIYIKAGMTNQQNTLQVKNAEKAGGDPSVTTKTYLKFDLSAMRTRLDTIEDAGLHLTTSMNQVGSNAGQQAATTVFVYGLTDESLDDWNELNVIWDNAPANDVTSNGLDMGKVVALGSIDIPANVAPDSVGYMSAELANFLKADTNGVVTLILRREDTYGAHNLRFRSKEDAMGIGNMELAPTLEVVLPDDPDFVPPFDQVVGAANFRADYYDSSWFGRFQYGNGHIARNGLGYFWTGAVKEDTSMFLWFWDLDQWVWTSASVYPYMYLYGDQEWIYMYTEPELGVYLWLYSTSRWVQHEHPGWEYPLTEEEMTARMLANIASAPHPRILLSLDDIPALREKVTQDWLQDAYLKLKIDANSQIQGSSFAIPYSATIGRRMQDTISTHALIGYMEDDVSMIRKAIDYTLYQIRTFTPDELENNNPGSPHLGLGDVIHAIAIAYDWLYPHLTPSEEAEIRASLELLGAMQYENVQNTYNGTDPFGDSSNHNAVGNGGLGLAAIALGDQPVWIEQAIRQIRRYMEFSTDAEGWNFEGRSYFGYGGWGAFPFASALEKLGGPDLFAEQPKYDTVAVDYFLRQMPPYRSTSGIAAAFPFITRSQDQIGMWLWLHVNGVNGNRSYGSAGSDISFLPYTLIWADPTLESLSPIGAGLPLDKVFPSDRALFRDGWDPLDSVVTFTTGWTMHSGHRVRSDNSFNFYSLGEQFSISPSDAQTRMEVLHSLVMVDEPRRTRNAAEYPHGAKFQTVSTDADFAYIKSDATTSCVYYLEADGWTSPDKRKVDEAIRHLLFARSPAGLKEPYILVVDDLTARAESAQFSWLFQTDAGNTVDLGTSGNTFQIIGENLGNLLDVEFLAPAGLANGILSHEGRDEIKGRWSDERIASTLTTINTSIVGKSVRFIALLRAHEAGTEAPAYTFSGTETDGQITVVLSDGTTDTITINGGELTFSRVAP
ncbi:MAG TPA: DNRLRE domain-containing protein, partial [Oceanipulchritudo sp.]|nr:DNRLRE domain-containing protein [Oceanipulchritudo sp.]